MTVMSEAKQLARRAYARSPVVLRRHARGAQPPQWMPPGHFYSPYPDLGEYGRRAPGLLDPARDLPGIDLREDEQVALAEVIGKLVADIPFPAHDDGRYRYWADNPAYAWSDGAVLHALLRHVGPRHIVEVGSGHSSAMILDTWDGWLDPEVEITFVEPYADLLRSLLHEGDNSRVTIHEAPVQDVPLDVFTRLGAGDVVFFDLTHVVKPGSDVNHVILEVLPRLAPGVWVHFHDMFWPFEYPAAWVREGRAWQEAYLLRAFLAFNPTFEIRWFQSFMWLRHHDLVEREVPWATTNPGGNLWLQKVA